MPGAAYPHLLDTSLVLPPGCNRRLAEQILDMVDASICRFANERLGLHCRPIRLHAGAILDNPSFSGARALRMCQWTPQLDYGSLATWACVLRISVASSIVRHRGWARMLDVSWGRTECATRARPSSIGRASKGARLAAWRQALGPTSCAMLLLPPHCWQVVLLDRSFVACTLKHWQTTSTECP